jgi:hypothetical protein
VTGVGTVCARPPLHHVPRLADQLAKTDSIMGSLKDMNNLVRLIAQVYRTANRHRFPGGAISRDVRSPDS